VGTIHGLTGATGATGATGGDVNIVSGVNITNTLSVQQIQDTTAGSSGPAGTVDYDWTQGDVFYVTSISGNWTANITHLPTTANKTYGLVFMLDQQAMPGYIDALEIQGTPNTILWAGASAPTATAFRTEVESFTLYYSGSNWVTLGQYSSFG
jgi:hypothetical protein